MDRLKTRAASYDGHIRMAGFFGLSLRECMEKHSYREYRTWVAWYKEQVFFPERSDYYLMQLAAKMDLLVAEKGTQVNITDYMISKEQEIKKSLTESDIKEISDWARNKWAAALKKELPPKQGNSNEH